MYKNSNRWIKVIFTVTEIVSKILLRIIHFQYCFIKLLFQKSRLFLYFIVFKNSRIRFNRNNQSLYKSFGLIEPEFVNFWKECSNRSLFWRFPRKIWNSNPNRNSKRHKALIQYYLDDWKNFVQEFNRKMAPNNCYWIVNLFRAFFGSIENL